MNTKDGKESVTKKQSTANSGRISPDEIYADKFKLDEALINELDEAGLACRFINFKQYRDNYGVHKSGWVAYKRKSKDPSPAGELFGNDPDGYVRRGDMILAVKTKEATERHKQFLKQRSTTLQANYNKEKAQELRKLMRDSGVKAEIHEGFDENGDKDDEE